jgi:hypothetical protein
MYPDLLLVNLMGDQCMSDISNYITPPTHSFAGLPVCTQLNDLAADIAIIGLHFVSPYPQKLTPDAPRNEPEAAPDAIRRQSSIFIDHWDHYDFNSIHKPPAQPVRIEKVLPLPGEDRSLI